MAQASASETLGQFVATSEWGAVPDAVREAGLRSILNHLGCALGVARDPAVVTALAVMRGFAGAPVATVVGQGVRLDAMTAAFVNAVGSNLLDYDDTHLDTVIHPAAPIAPPLLALAEQRGLPGAAVIHAFLLGGEVACRIGNAVSPGHYARGWHITASCGVFGAAAGAARLLGLDAARTANAIGIAASLSGSIIENLPTAAKNVGVGNAARHGLQAALFAEAGWEAAPAAIEGRLGWAQATGGAADMAVLLDGLGTRWEIARNTFKPYPAGIVFHAVIEACLGLRETIAGADIARVEVVGDALLIARGDRVVRNARDARVSIHHCAALGFVRGRAGVPDFEQDAVDDAALAAFRAKVVAVEDAALPRGASRVRVWLGDGERFEARVDEPEGSEARPMSDAALDAKFLDNAALGGFAARGPAMLAAVRGLAQVRDVAEVMALLA
ncbi:MmgE/PrpD family protein [Plastoroseomonas arctica]|uniref:MmgE/PrpD family protein n=1 Tax=Plastoroseomonas arctica TaxID=1509237 RepID=A0AAF1K7Z3_9PROT|nr:MmgE/PrpD family protein [Plastoroseomonas arctica]MBR0657306.1 MmgE/PrpD family protein [Plastoroseomonas arctica]